MRWCRGVVLMVDTPEQAPTGSICVIPGKRMLDPGSSLFYNIHKLHGLKEQDKDKRPALKQTRLKMCHPGLPGSPPKRAAVWWGGLSRDPVFSKSFEVRAGFGIGGNLYSFHCRLELQTTSQHGVQRAFSGCKYPPDAWALWTSCVTNPELLPRIMRALAFMREKEPVVTMRAK